MHKLILASQSPRRLQLLSEAGFQFEVITVEISEILEKNLTIENQIVTLSRRKAEALDAKNLLTKGQNQMIIAADTLVILNDEPLGKPKNKSDAFDMLTRLSGTSHKVITGVSIWDYDLDFWQSGAETTEVDFLTLSETAIKEYIETSEPMDKAGSYGIQGFGRAFVKTIRGPFDNVVGLPVQLVKLLLKRQNYVGTSS